MTCQPPWPFDRLGSAKMTSTKTLCDNAAWLFGRAPDKS